MNILNCFLENRPGGANLRGYRMARQVRQRGVNGNGFQTPFRISYRHEIIRGRSFDDE
jgi:hypothetical protein